MLFESSRLRGRVSALLIVLLPIITGIVSTTLSLLRMYTPNTPFGIVIIMIPTYTFLSLFLIAMSGFAKYYNDTGIFRNSLYAFITSITTGVASSVVMYTFAAPILDELSAYVASPGNIPPLSLFLPLLQVMAIIWVVMSVAAILNGFFYRRAFYTLAEKSENHNFKQAGFFMFIGGLLMIILIGALLVFIGWIYAVLGFFSMKEDVQTNSV